MSDTKNTKPVKRFRSGDCSASIWENIHEKDGRSIALYSIRFQRRYKDAESGKWNHTESFNTSSLDNLLALVLQAIPFCNAKGDSEPEEDAAA